MKALAACTVRHSAGTVSALACAALLLSPTLIAQQPSQTPPAGAPAAGGTAAEKSADALPPLPPDAHVDQTMQLGGRTLKYTATVGTIPLYSADGSKKTGDVVFTSYVMEGTDRPVTFALNGGPGASSVFLNFGAIGPKHVAFGDEGDSPSNPLTLADNPGTWLDFTDLVFIDPIGTGFSRSHETPDQTKKDFFSTENDIHYLSRVVFDWLVKNQRLRSRNTSRGKATAAIACRESRTTCSRSSVSR
jgi:carboxypeptidase C (cathepsin A)